MVEILRKLYIKKLINIKVCPVHTLEKTNLIIVLIKPEIVKDSAILNSNNGKDFKRRKDIVEDAALIS